MGKEYAIKRTRAIYIELLLFQNELIKRINELVVKQDEDYIKQNVIPVYDSNDHYYSVKALDDLNKAIDKIEEVNMLLYSMLYDMLFDKKIIFVDEADNIYDEEILSDEKAEEIISSLESYKTRKK